MAAQSETLAARRYARALFDLVPASERATLRSELQQAVEALAGHPELSQALTSPVRRPDARRKLSAAIFASGSSWTRRVLDLLAERGRLPLLPQIARAFADLANQADGVVTAQAATAVALEAPQVEALTSAIHRATGSKVALETAVDSSLLGGVRLTLEGLTYDGSVRARLAALGRALRPERA